MRLSRFAPRYAAAMLLAAACGGNPELDTRTFELKYIDAEMAIAIIDPYVYGDRPDAPGTMSASENFVTVRESPDNLEKIARVLEQYDRPRPGIRLHFQIIEADGDAASDPRISDVEAQLRELFRFEGYRLIGEADVGVTEGGSVMQLVDDPNSTAGFEINAAVGRIRAVGDTGIVRLEVHLSSIVGGRNIGGVLQTAVNARVGQTIVLGNAQMRSQARGTTILTVKPVLTSP